MSPNWLILSTVDAGGPGTVQLPPITITLAV
jgi:hypothetical protein